MTYKQAFGLLRMTRQAPAWVNAAPFAIYIQGIGFVKYLKPSQGNEFKKKSIYKVELYLGFRDLRRI